MTPVTLWVVGDFQKVSGRKLLLSALKHLVSKINTVLFNFFNLCYHLGCTQDVLGGITDKSNTLTYP